jgi:energy-coupling factor transporter ATP-binding protein EcfA2
VNPAPTKFADAFSADLQTRIQQGSHLILYGPRGIGKSTLIHEFAKHYRSHGIPCGTAPSTTGLPDIVAALAEAYPDTKVDGVGRKTARMRLRSVADANPGVLLLDHVTKMTMPMLGYLRRLRGGIAGTLLVVDVDSTREREGLRDWHAGALSIRMPAIPNIALDDFLVVQIQVSRLPSLDPRVRRQLVRRARGRIGWITECVRGLRERDYCSGGRLHLASLCIETEMALRQSRIGPRTARCRTSVLAQ